jgi:hypothetical protein
MSSDIIHLVMVTTDDREHRLWAAATSRDDAVDRVLAVVPEGWAARLMDEPMQMHESAVLNIARGEVRELPQR